MLTEGLRVPPCERAVTPAYPIIGDTTMDPPARTATLEVPPRQARSPVGLGAGQQLDTGGELEPTASCGYNPLPAAVRRGISRFGICSPSGTRSSGVSPLRQPHGLTMSRDEDGDN